MVTCMRCGTSKSRERFVIDKRRPADHVPTCCKDCHNAKLRANKDARRVWHECSWCGAERFIDRRLAVLDPLCANDQRLDILQRARARQYFESLRKPEQAAWTRARKYTREVVRDLVRAHKRVTRELQWTLVMKPRECPCGDVFSSTSWVRIYCNACAPKPSKMGNWISRQRRLAILRP